MRLITRGVSLCADRIHLWDGLAGFWLQQGYNHSTFGADTNAQDEFGGASLCADRIRDLSAPTDWDGLAGLWLQQGYDHSPFGADTSAQDEFGGIIALRRLNQRSLCADRIDRSAPTRGAIASGCIPGIFSNPWQKRGGGCWPKALDIRRVQNDMCGVVIQLADSEYDIWSSG